MSSPLALCVGVITIDTIALVDRYPAEDERVRAQQIMRSIGGPAAVAAIALSRLGISSGVVGTIGDDADGKEILAQLKLEGVNTDGISISPHPTAGSVIVASKEHSSRAISTRQPPVQSTPSERAKSLAASAEWIHVDHVGINLLDALSVRRGGSAKISFDAGYDIADFDVSQVDLFAPNDKSLLSRSPGLTIEAALQAEYDKSQALIVATEGGKGSIAFSPETGIISAPSFAVEIASTLGAGDVFHGAFLAQIIQGRPLHEALLRANAVAALSCRGLDGSSAIPTPTELDSFMSGVK